MPKPRPPMRTVTIRLSEDDWRAVNARALSLGLRVSPYVRMTLRETIREWDAQPSSTARTGTKLTII